MTASSSHDDLADLLGNLADNEPGLDEDTLASLEGAEQVAESPAEPSDDQAVKPAFELDDATEQEATSPAAPAGDEVQETAETEEEVIAEAVFDDTEDDSEADTAIEAEAEPEAEVDAELEAEHAQHAEALATVADGDGEVEESAEMEQFAAVTAAPVAAGKAKRRQGRLSAATSGDAMKATMAPILLTVGLIVMIPAVWGTLLLMGVSMPLSERSNANTMATFMLLCWPIAIALIVTAIILFMQVSKAKKKAAAREQR